MSEEHELVPVLQLANPQAVAVAKAAMAALEIQCESAPLEDFAGVELPAWVNREQGGFLLLIEKGKFEPGMNRLSEVLNYKPPRKLRNKRKVLEGILDNVRTYCAGHGEREVALRHVCQMLANSVPYYNWVGFYMVDPDGLNLQLGPFVGAPTEHMVIPVGRGMCGQAAAAGRTIIADDVAAEAEYLSCSLDVKSEIVVPILKGGRVVAILDIDSHELAAFKKEDRRMLEEVCQLLAGYF